MTMFSATDPRARLTTAPSATAAKGDGTVAAPADYLRFRDLASTDHDDHGVTWIARGQNFVLAYSEVHDGWRAERRNQVDEYVVLLPGAGMQATVETARERIDVDGYSLVVVPPGDSTLTVHGGGQVVRLLTAGGSPDLADRALNASSYRTAHPTVAPFSPWPSSPAGNRVRTYSLDIQRDEQRFGRIFRCSTIMVNYLYPTVGPRDTTRMSPHTHDDFEQASLALTGDFYHHLRWPWTINKADWRPDEHEHCPAPSLVVIPPPVVHTSEAVGPDANQLIDIFCPPRHDFSAQPGWVLNADEYPMPE